MSSLPSIGREYTLQEIAIMTRAGPARLLGIERDPRPSRTRRGGRRAVYGIDAGPRADVRCGETVAQERERVVSEGKILAPETWGATHVVRPDFDAAIERRVGRFFEDYRDMRLGSFKLGPGRSRMAGEGGWWRTRAAGRRRREALCSKTLLVSTGTTEIGTSASSMASRSRRSSGSSARRRYILHLT